MLKIAELGNAGLKIRDTLPLIPLEQILARGIGTVVFAGLLFPTLAVGLLVGVRVAERSTRRVRAKPSDQESELDEVKRDLEAAQRGDVAAYQRVVDQMNQIHRQVRRLSWRVYLLLLIAAIALLAVTAVSSLQVALGGALLLVGIVVTNVKPPDSLRELRLLVRPIALASGCFLLGAVLAAFINPAPLPEARLAGPTGAITGGLVTTTDQRWVLRLAPDRLSVLPAERVREARVTQFDNDESVVELVTGWKPFWRD
jgi:hypothetical protein